MGLADQPDHPAYRLYDELHLRVQVLQNDSMTVGEIADLERQCSALQAHLLEAAIVWHERVANQQWADDEALQRPVNEQVGRMMNQGGLADRLRERIRRLQDENRQQGLVMRLQDEVLRQQGTDIREL
jgi:hypothetical protein